MDVLSHPLVIILVGAIAFVAKDMFMQSRQSSKSDAVVKTELDTLRQRVSKIEGEQVHTTDLALTIVRLEEQVRNLAEDIKFLLEVIRGNRTNG